MQGGDFSGGSDRYRCWALSSSWTLPRRRADIKRIAASFLSRPLGRSPSPAGIEEQYDVLEVPATVHLNDVIDALEMQVDEALFLFVY